MKLSKLDLFFKHKHFCSAPWNYLTVKPNGDLSTCVHGSLIGNAHNIDNLEYFLKTDSAIQNIRATLLDDEVPNNCKHCQNKEVGDWKYIRGLYNDMFMSSNTKYNSLNEFNIHAIDLHWGSTCQLKCVSCGPSQSSSLAIEQGVPIVNMSNDVADNIIHLLTKNQHVLKEIYLSGGEPTLIHHNVRLLSSLDPSKMSKDFLIRINTNMMFDLDNKVISKLKKFPNVLFTISADAMGDRFEYIRRGASWEKFISNLNELKKHDNFTWRLNTVFSSLSADQIADLHDYFIEKFNITDITINQIEIGHLGQGKSLQARNLPTEVKAKCIDRLNEHKERYSGNANLVGEIELCLQELHRHQEIIQIEEIK